MRDIKTLLQIVIDSLKDGHKYGFSSTGICGEIVDLVDLDKISTSEGDYLHTIIGLNKPSINIEFSKHTKNKHWLDETWWWGRMDYYPETRQIRIDYLEHLKESL